MNILILIFHQIYLNKLISYSNQMVFIPLFLHKNIYNHLIFILMVILNNHYNHNLINLFIIY